MILARWIAFALEAVASVVVARFVGPVGKGALTVLSVIGGIAVQIGNLGLHAAATHFTAREADRGGRIAWLCLVMAPAIGLGMAGLVGGVLVLFPALIPDVPTPLLLITLAGIPFSFLLLFFQSVLLGQQRARVYNALWVSGRLVALPVVLVILVVFDGGLVALLVAGLCITAGTALVAVRLVFREIREHCRLEWALLRQMLGYGYRSYVSCVLAFLIIRSDMLLVNYFLGGAQAGIYAVAVNLADLLLVFPTAVGTMLFPRVSARPGDDGALTAAACRHTAAGMLLLCLGAALLCRPGIRFLYGAAFAGAAGPFLLLVPGVLGLALEMILMNDLAGRGLPPIVMAVPAVGLAVNLGLNVCFIPRFGLAAAAASSSVAYWIMLGIAWRGFQARTGWSARACGVLRRTDLQALWRRIGRRPGAARGGVDVTPET